MSAAVAGADVVIANLPPQTLRAMKLDYEQLKAIKPDIILMDIGLGDGIDGCETTRRIKTIPEVAHIPVIALTASAFETDRQNALSAGCTDFDTKPVDLPRLLGKMNQALHA